MASLWLLLLLSVLACRPLSPCHVCELLLLLLLLSPVACHAHPAFVEACACFHFRCAYRIIASSLPPTSPAATSSYLLPLFPLRPLLRLLLCLPVDSFCCYQSAQLCLVSFVLRLQCLPAHSLCHNLTLSTYQSTPLTLSCASAHLTYHTRQVWSPFSHFHIFTFCFVL